MVPDPNKAIIPRAIRVLRPLKLVSGVPSLFTCIVLVHDHDDNDHWSMMTIFIMLYKIITISYAQVSKLF